MKNRLRRGGGKGGGRTGLAPTSLAGVREEMEEGVMKIKKKKC